MKENDLSGIGLDPSSAKKLTDNVRLLVELASSEPDFETSKAQLGRIYSFLNENEKILGELSRAIESAKTYTMKAINNRIIDSHSLNIKDDDK